jgi:hypothetical protein
MQDTPLKKESDMAQNRIQFQKSLSLPELLNSYGTEDQCAAALEKMRWPQGYICPDCESKSHCIVWHGKSKLFSAIVAMLR